MGPRRGLAVQRRARDLRRQRPAVHAAGHSRGRPGGVPVKQSQRRVVGGLVAAVLAGDRSCSPTPCPLGIVLKGALFGSATGLLAVGLVLTYRTTRIINFAYGAMGSLGGGLAAALAVGQGVELGRRRRSSASPPAWRSGRSSSGSSSAGSPTRPRLVLTVATIGLAQLLGGLAIFLPDWLGAARVHPAGRRPRSPTPRSTSTRSPSRATTCCCWPSCPIVLVVLVVVPAAHRGRHGRPGHGREHGPGPAARHPGQPALAAAVVGRRRPGRPDRRAAGAERGRAAHRGGRARRSCCRPWPRRSSWACAR